MNDEEIGRMHIFEDRKGCERLLRSHLAKKLKSNYISILFRDVD